MDAGKKRHSFSQLNHSQYIESIYDQYCKDPESIESSWRRFFEGMEFAQDSPLSQKGGEEKVDAKALRLLDAYRSVGYLSAHFNPLVEDHEKVEDPRLSAKTYGLEDESTKVKVKELFNEEEVSVSKLKERLEKLYCGSIGFEFAHIQDSKIRSFIQERIEKGYFHALSAKEKIQIYHFLNRSELFENFIHTKFVGQKRFSIEGLETFIPIVRAIIDQGSEMGLDEIVICMAHRGRLNLLANIFEKPYSLLFHEFGENYEPSQVEGSGDVKYHKGYSADIETRLGKRLHLSIPPNSSHLESVNCVALGQVKAKQVHKKDESKERILAIQVHGDASVAGQGVIYEGLQLYQLEGYESGGSLHIIMDNQIGFTTPPDQGRSTPFPSDIAKAFEMPILHVNAEDPEACVLAAYFAIEIRQKFKKDVFIHLTGYRKYGHNEGDEPSYTQPLLYQKIRKHKSIRVLYKNQLIEEGVISKETAQNDENEFKQKLQKSLEESSGFMDKMPEPELLFGNRWHYWKEMRLQDENDLFKTVPTQVDEKVLKDLAWKMTEIPSDFTPHKKIAQLLGMRRAAVIEPQKEAIMDWGLVENLAYATLLNEGYPIRLAGQDCQRGTFSHRHAVIVDQNTQKPFIPLNHLKEDQASLSIYNSPLSEYGCLGFEYGYSISTSKGLVIWEAQFGDFANGAQIMIDAYVANGEEKWNRLTNLVMLLPHGYEGQGPEHSSARIERYLQLCGNKNMVILNPTLPSQLFHALRRQALKTFRKPLIIFTPKKLLRHPQCVASLDDLTIKTFSSVLKDPKPIEKVKTLVFCSGKVFYDAYALREKYQVKDLALVRIEQLYPLDNEAIKEVLEHYKGYSRLVWLQEEPENMGAWYYIKPYLEELLPKGVTIEYCGRTRSASPAQGSHKKHQATFDAFMSSLFPGETS